MRHFLDIIILAVQGINIVVAQITARRRGIIDSFRVKVANREWRHPWTERRCKNTIILECRDL
jgi:hypothetical protein